MTQAIRLLSAQPFSSSESNPNTNQTLPSLNLKSPDITDPFASGTLTYSTTGSDTFPAPSAYPSRRHSWIHIFPEGFIHQHPSIRMRYFKWGVSRLILEAEPLPTIIPIFISGTEQVMHESREFPRFLPRPGKKITIAIGQQVDGEKVFGDLRRRWKGLVGRQKEASRKKGGDWNLAMGELTEGLKYGQEAVDLRKEVTRRVRMEVLKVRRDLGFPDEDPKASLVETWIDEGGKREGRMGDNSWVKDT